MVRINKKPITWRHLFFRKWHHRLCRFLFGFHPSVYVQDMKQVHFGKQVWIGPHVCFITRNHRKDDPYQHDEHQPICIGEQCWIGANAVILPGVILGEQTIVGAGSVVTKSFKKGHEVIAGNPAQRIGVVR